MKIKKLINLLVLILAAVVCTPALNFAQDSSKITLDYGTDMVSRYVWRGTQFGGASPNVQPYVEAAFGNFVFGSWGAYSLGGFSPFQELDFYAAFSLMDDMVSITATDYYFPDESVDYQYFVYDELITGHLFELSASFNGTDKIPLSVLIATNLFGADAIRISDDSTTSFLRDGIQYSTYLELGYSTICSNLDLDVFLGVNLTNPREADASTGYPGETGFYGSKMGVVNIGITVSKELKISNTFSLPVMASVITNPQSQKIFMVFGFSL
ncbi:MAG: hypothetical protein IIA45_08595 [Bacteroidetes bacterium]|nr:hypothetical protein [Bacteroidota bacterium]